MHRHRRSGRAGRRGLPAEDPDDAERGTRRPRSGPRMTDQRTTEGVQLRDRIDRFLAGSGLGGTNARVVPLTGDASDRKYFRIIPADGPSIVLALHAGPIDFAALP